MDTKYGQLPDESLFNYLDRVINSIFKCLPLKENECETLEQHLESTLRELIGNKKLILQLNNDALFLSLLGTLNNLIDEDNFKKYRSDIFKCIGLVNKLQDKYSLENNDE